MTFRMSDFIADEGGATAIEYGLIAALIAVAAIAGFTAFGNGLTALFNYVRDTAGNSIENAPV